MKSFCTLLIVPLTIFNPKPPAAQSGVVPFDAQAITKLTVRELKQLLHESNLECLALLKNALKLP